eukprot:839228-Pleurochrysis_carterae.AAC.1
MASAAEPFSFERASAAFVSSIKERPVLLYPRFGLTSSSLIAAPERLPAALPAAAAGGFAAVASLSVR